MSAFNLPLRLCLVAGRIQLMDLKLANIMLRLSECDDDHPTDLWPSASSLSPSLAAALRLSIELIDMGDSLFVDPTESSPIFTYVQQAWCHPDHATFKKVGQRDVDMCRGGTDEVMVSSTRTFQ